MEPAASLIPLRQADSDEQVIRLWLSRYAASPNTARGYAFEAGRFVEYHGKPLGLITFGDLTEWVEDLSVERQPSTVRRAVAAIKSLYKFSLRIGYLRFDPAAVLIPPPARDTLADRILTQAEVARMIEAASPVRSRLLIRTLYITGCRVSEALSLNAADLHEKHVVIYGKGGKTRTIAAPSNLVEGLKEWERYANGGRIFGIGYDDARKIVMDAARLAGISKPVTPHWLRHSHATHALENGASIHLVAATLGHSTIAVTGRYLHARPSESSSLYIQS